jgi:hypothetical protein
MLIRIVFAVFTLILAVLLFREMTVDACLDAGGRFDYPTRNCETLPDLNYIPLINRDVWYRPLFFTLLAPAFLMFLLYKALIRFILKR